MDTVPILPKFNTWEPCSVTVKPPSILVLTTASLALVAGWQSLRLHSTPPTEGGNNGGLFWWPGLGLQAWTQPLRARKSNQGAFSGSTILGMPVTKPSAFITSLPRSDTGEGGAAGPKPMLHTLSPLFQASPALPSWGRGDWMPVPLEPEQSSGPQHPVTRRHWVELSSLKLQADYGGFGADPALGPVGSIP